jgi:RimJ/RimL family protein N-acetyltransferase
MYGGDVRNLEPYTLENATNWYHKMLQNPIEWAIEFDGRCIGQARLTVNYNDKRARHAAGIFDEKLLNQGIGTEITKAVLQYAFGTLGLHRVDLRVLEYNKRAIRCYEKCGFLKEGVEREGALIEGKWENDWMMSILEYEYDALFG